MAKKNRAKTKAKAKHGAMSSRNRPAKLQANGNVSEHKRTDRAVEVGEVLNKAVEASQRSKELLGGEALNRGTINREALDREELESGILNKETPSREVVNKEALNRANQVRDRQQGRSEQNEFAKSNAYSKLSDACARSTNLRGKLKRHNSRFMVELPTGLPSMLLLRALQKDSTQHKALTAERLADVGQHTQLQLDVEGLTELQLQQFIVELDELIGEFTARS